MKYQSLSFLLLACSLFFLEGCQSTNTPEHANDLMIDGWVGPTPYPSATDARPVYCYRTLGDEDCYSRPQPGWEERLTASYEPDFKPIFIQKAPIKSAPVAPIASPNCPPSLAPMKLNP